MNDDDTGTHPSNLIRGINAWQGVAPPPTRPAWTGSYSGFDLNDEIIEMARHVTERNYDVGQFNRVAAECVGIAIVNAVNAGFLTRDSARDEIEALANTMRERAGIAKKQRER